MQKGVRYARTGWEGWVDYCAREGDGGMVGAGALAERRVCRRSKNVFAALTGLDLPPLSGEAE